MSAGIITPNTFDKKSPLAQVPVNAAETGRVEPSTQVPVVDLSVVDIFRSGASPLTGAIARGISKMPPRSTQDCGFAQNANTEKSLA